MPSSRAVSFQYTCPACQCAFPVEIWLIVDVRERPDLAGRIVDGTLYSVRCIHCSEIVGHVDTPLLLFFQDAHPLAFYSPPSTVPPDDPHKAIEEIGFLRKTLGADWNEDWILQGALIVPRDILGDALRTTLGWPEDGGQEKGESVREIGEEETGFSAETLGGELPPPSGGATMQGWVRALLDAPDQDAAIRAIADYPELLSDEAEALLERFLAAARAARNTEREALIQERLAMVRHCLAMGLRGQFGMPPTPQVDEQVLHYFSFLPADAQQAISLVLEPGYRLALRSELEGEHTFLPAAMPDEAGEHPGNGAAALSPELGERTRRLFSVDQILEWDRSLPLLNAIITLARHTLECPDIEAHPFLKVTVKTILGDTLVMRYKATGETGDIEEAVAILREAAARNEADPHFQAMSLNHLSMALLAQFDRSGALEDLEAALRAERSAIAANTPDGPDWDHMNDHLGYLLVRRFGALGDISDLDAALAAHAVAGEGQDADFSHLSYLALALVRRAEILGSRADLDAGIAALRQAVAIRPPGDLGWENVHNDLGLALLVRYETYREPDDLHQAIAALEESLTMVDEGTPSWATSISNLSVCLMRRYDLSGDREDIAAAIALLRRVVKHVEEGTADWVIWTGNMGSAYYTRYNAFGKAWDRRETIRAYKQVLGASDAGQWLEQVLMAGRMLGNLYFDEKHWQQAASAYGKGVEAANTLHRTQLLGTEREAWLARADNLYRHAAYALARTGRLREAMVTAEQGLARDLGLTLERDQANLRRAEREAPEVVTRYQRATTRLRRLEARARMPLRALDGEPGHISSAEARDQARQAYAEINQALESIRQVPGYQKFLSEPDWDDVAGAVELETPLAYLLVTDQSSVTLLAYRQELEAEVTVEALWCERFTTTHLEELLEADAGTSEGLSSGSLVGQIADPAHLRTALDLALPVLGSVFAHPLALRLRELRKTHVTLLPGGLLSLLPLHAAPYPDGNQTACLLDDFDISYASSARVLTVAQREARERGTEAPFLLGIGNPSRNGGEGDLPFAALEVGGAAWRLPPDRRRIMLGAAATVEEFWAALPQATIAHLACHGTFNPSSPLDAALLMAEGGRMTLRDAMNAEEGRLARLRLAVLSACQSGIREFRRVPDEAVSLPSGFLYAGVPGVIGTFWSVNDCSTAMLMEEFYRLYIGQDEECDRSLISPVHALCIAQRQLRDTTAGAFAARCRDLRKGVPATDAARYERVSALWRYFELLEPGDRPFEHPYHWAAFAFNGA